MAKTEYIDNVPADIADSLCESYIESYDRFTPHLSYDSQNGRIEMHGSNNAMRERARLFITRKMASTGNGPAATAKQIGYLKSLVETDPAAAMSLNLDDSKIESLTKFDASKFINQLLNY